MDRQHDPISLNPDQAEFVRHQVESGGYRSPSDVVNDGLRVLEEMDRYLHANRKSVSEKIAEGLAAGRRGEVVSAEEVWAELDQLDKDDAAKEARPNKRPRQ